MTKTIFGIIVYLAVFVVGTGFAEEKMHINLPGRTSELPFSDGVMVGDTLYLSGKLGLVPGTRTLPEDVDQEVKNILDGMKATLQAAGMTMDNLVYVQVFCPDVSLYEKFNAIYRTYFTAGKFPARAFIGSGPLLFGAHFEVQGIAHKASTK